MARWLVELLILVPVPMGEGEPKGPPPTIEFVKFDERGIFSREFIQVRCVAVEKIESFVVNGQQQKRTVTVSVEVPTIQKVTIDSRNYDFFEPDGKPANPKDWMRVFGEGAIAVIAADANLPHPSYLKIMKPGTLILVPKTPAPKIAP